MVEPEDVAKTILFVLEMQQSSPGAMVDSITLGEILGDREDLVWRPRQ